MNSEYRAAIGDKELRLYSISFRSESKITETPTLDHGIIRRFTGGRKDHYTLKGRISIHTFMSFSSYINSLMGTEVQLMIAGVSRTLMLTKGECTACEEGLCEFTIELEEAEA